MNCLPQVMSYHVLPIVHSLRIDPIPVATSVHPSLVDSELVISIPIDTSLKKNHISPQSTKQTELLKKIPFVLDSPIIHILNVAIFHEKLWIYQGSCPVKTIEIQGPPQQRSGIRLQNQRSQRSGSGVNWTWNLLDMLYGGFHSYGDTPIAGWFRKENPI